ncbi:MAG: matrixin family metalloprotease [Gemmatimonadetes bacterium]|nr:matrixin family metalloprotease [Gemmatimonadota bacterium]
MRRVVTLLSLLVAAMAVFIVVQATRVQPRRAAVPAPSPETVAAPTLAPEGPAASTGPEADLVSVRTSALPAPQRDFAEIQRRLVDGERGTYIREILLQRSDNNARWPDRQFEPLRVWVQPHSDLPDFQRDYPERVRQAFDRWTRAGVPVAFTFVVDSARADIPVVWVDKFEMPISGRTRWTRDQHWWIIGASIELALRHQSGEPLGAEAIRAIALHEVGHLIGLDHTMDERSIMAARVRVSELSQADEYTAQLIYSIPPGPVTKP